MKSLVAVSALFLGCGNLLSQEPTARALEMVNAQMRAQVAMVSLEFDYSATALQVQQGPHTSIRMQVLRVLAPTAGGAGAYLVGLADSNVLRLGGFAAPELIQAARRIVYDSVTRASLMDAARTLAILADPEGAEDYHLPYQTGDQMTVDSVSQAWRAARLGLGVDTVVARSDSGFRVRVTILTHPTRMVRTPWRGFVYIFEFSQSGELQGWARNTGQTFEVLPAR